MRLPLSAAYDDSYGRFVGVYELTIIALNWQPGFTESGPIESLSTTRDNDKI
jgi:hypothetical protein